MRDIPNDLGKRIVEAAQMAVSQHLEQDANPQQEAKDQASELRKAMAAARLRGLVGDIMPEESSHREAA
jgi:hypothetical protein